MKEKEVRYKIESIEVKITPWDWKSVKVNSLRKYNKKAFFKCDTAFLAGLFFIYNTEYEGKNTEYELNSIVTVTLDGVNESHKTFESFISYLLSLPNILEVNHQ